MPSNKKKNSKKKKPPASAKRAEFAIGELDARKACKLLPTERQTKFVRDYSRAVDLLEESKESLKLSPYVEIDKPASYFDNDDAVECLHNLHACACRLQAIPLLTDMRLPVEGYFLKMLPGSCMSLHVICGTHQVGHPNLMYMGMRHFLVMLVDTIMIMMGSHLGEARLVVHELEAQLNGNY